MKTLRPIKDLYREELAQWLQERGEPSYRLDQLEGWLYRHDVASFHDMTNLPKTFREVLLGEFCLFSLEEVAREEALDGTTKFLFSTLDGERVEAVLIPDRDRLTLCVSTQVGCRMGCRFCLTGRQGFRRNLTRGEMLDQVLLVRREVRNQGRELTNVVFMGMGEPLDNYEESLAALRVLISDKGLGFSHRKVTLSTVGLVPQVRRLAREGLDLTLALSLNATDDETRSLLMPINRRYSLEEVVAALRGYPLPPRKRFTLEYVVLEGVNHSPQDARRLARLVEGLRVKVNLIPFNPFPGAEFERPSEREVLEFQAQLRQLGLSTFIRQSRGQEISAACGLLRWRRGA
ncbi:MAG TPA: 23S rRNA (adenine(2503)-C(2))-methyltransferase RlmN [Thermosulfidibacter takaii]|uniref:Probable dual-specificity RNA methyltransferase RlmN n=1 Tax=Thermosulfidibacter takaii TaxID=412593 RepID=A0A7C0YBN2_9BACT|nr:23S rRNA (adenine(2503)-C(2))-methyltransferase RlmN [Thermosulfidibacter takaii]